ncbi:3-phosphoserine/phosphohydroxythreonine transaminase [Metabacillus arenae]|uniref:Phosphoserine aminotransferase n=1 Tax=Metabacillus arenae TaxID=2771434 RepID=A0A926NMU1_9BACI|nr:3-phosphoserine/phosphohydroxythreonine transaminase [Metabacillus arenae]MBD1380706.1 3-phosphoserine/phosphohydroxythreonine transaminase [Metabacillus arenae]
MSKVLNFNAGPAALPRSVLEQAQAELVDFNGTGMSVMELSHRSGAYDEVHVQAKEQLKSIMNIPDTHDVLFLQGGASHQFAMLPMNFLHSNKVGYYVLSGSWSEKALSEAEKIGDTKVVASSKEDTYSHIPKELALDSLPNAAYLHLTSNNTIFGTQWGNFPDVNVPLVADMSSDILSKEIDVSKFDCIYAGAQKNLGPSGVTVVIIRKDWIKEANKAIPKILQYETHAKANSLYNTPPTFSIYILSLVLNWVEAQGGIGAVQRMNEQKANLLYDCIDSSEGFYKGHASKESRSNMNVTFTLPNKELTEKFLKEAKELGMSGLNGHRSVGGCRASIYNAVPLEACEQLVEFMKIFKGKN